MAVITSRKDKRYSPDLRCSFCEGDLWPPFIVWWSAKELHFCSDCSRRMVQGLAADLVQLDAICRIHELGYHRVTLHRETEAQQERREQLEENAREAENWTAAAVILKK